MKKRSKKKYKKLIEITLPLKLFKKVRTPDLQLRKAARKVMKQINEHMKKDGWPLDYDMHKSDIFFEAYGHHLENYLLWALANNKKQELQIVTSAKGGLLIEKVVKKSKS